MPGILIGSLLVFILSLGSLAESKILGGQAIVMIADDIESAFTFAQKLAERLGAFSYSDRNFSDHHLLSLSPELILTDWWGDVRPCRTPGAEKLLAR